MGNALQSVSKAVDAKFIGGNPLESKFAAIDEGCYHWDTHLSARLAATLATVFDLLVVISTSESAPGYQHP